MTRPLLIDTMMANDELEMLECRLTELADVVDFFVIVEADVDHQDHPKPYHITNSLDRFTEWKDKLVIVKAAGLPTKEQDADPWARELAQREHVRTGLADIGAPADSVILHGDIDEIPSVLAARNVRPRGGFVSFQQRAHFWAVDWQYPPGWRGTVAAELRTIEMFGNMRNTRNMNPLCLPNAGWHLSWLGGSERALKKLGAFCHPEIEDRITDGLAADRFYREGRHVDGVWMVPVDVDKTWPRYVFERRCPDSWFRPR